MKGLLCMAAASVLAASVVSGPAAYAMNVPVAAAEDESGSSLDALLDDLENSTPVELNYANPLGYWPERLMLMRIWAFPLPFRILLKSWKLKMILRSAILW